MCGGLEVEGIATDPPTLTVTKEEVSTEAVAIDELSTGTDSQEYSLKAVNQDQDVTSMNYEVSVFVLYGLLSYSLHQCNIYFL